MGVEMVPNSGNEKLKVSQKTVEYLARYNTLGGEQNLPIKANILQFACNRNTYTY